MATGAGNGHAKKCLGGKQKQGQNIVYKKNTPLSNLWFSVLDIGREAEQVSREPRRFDGMGFE